MPPKLHPDLLRQPSPEAASELERVERQIIEFPSLKDKEAQALFAAKTELGSKEQELTQSLKAQKIQKSAFGAAQKANDQAQMDLAQGEINRLEDQINQQTAQRNYLKAKMDAAQAKVDLLEAQLALQVAEQLLQQAEIAQTFLESEPGRTLKGFEPVDLSLYRTYKTNQQKKLAEVEKSTQSLVSAFEGMAKLQPKGAAPAVQAAPQAATPASPTLATAPQPKASPAPQSASSTLESADSTLQP
ncbi:MAG: hypothetical protein A2600_09715 [Candidatus Lambdaproteobacteria bacterium RIFOXYD1_FULL_56_27]|uniref:Uncharacterized protein n=1 Tax=Candidatus Lambdaproteobacteria bacterium RIFOXYD2_FULL_56_26 TaxID=1817773 RepID=A0A1F6GV75_9PROT|nr:MAG: hypothetical protein A2557_04985 [Candidatus Lambdaproteobacteria bacterium RIFOXYD2_FULL_56_26]OGH02318.1 MAG: hypothetical protein A2426_03465 [Candidatus Lambdaproteobacteria bacterium RIFOXYC1_FULL_56_13]OGH10088.1 MAG: hypothetical protein A2600_09715 [Candidatus Lambdaproteobacteria bacterium RIFOXYD1_FULL_56_27]